MKKYNSFLGAFFSGDNGQGGYNAAYGKSALAKLYSSQDPAEQQMAAEGLARVDPETAGKWQQEQAKAAQQNLERKARMLASAPTLEAKQQLYASIRPEVSKLWAEAPEQYTPELDQMLTAWAGADGGQNTGVQSTFISGGKLNYLTRDGRAVDTGKTVDDRYTPIIDPVTGEVKGYGRGSNQLLPTGAGGTTPPPQDAGDPMNPVHERINYTVKAMKEAGVPVEQINAWADNAFAEAQKKVASDGVTVTAQTTPTARINPKPEAQKEPTWNNPVVEMRGGKQVRVRYNNQGGEQVMGDAEVAPPPRKAWTATGLEKYNKVRSDVQTASTISTMMDDMTNLFNDPEFELGPVQNKKYEYQNWSGGSTPQSRAYAKLSANFEKMRNDSLRLNAGVQTDGDAQRAWNEIMANMNDKELVKSRLADIKRYNEFALLEKRMQLENWEAEFGAPGGQRQQQPQAQSQPQASGGVRTVRTKQEYDSLPSGAEYIGPDGKPARKK